MSNASISAAFAVHLNSLSIPTHWQNTEYTPPADTIYLAESLIPAAVNPMGLAAGSSEAYEGIYQVLVYAPAGATKGGAYETADTVVGHFPKALELTRDSITTTVLRTEQNGAFMSGDRFVVPVSIYYRAMV